METSPNNHNSGNHAASLLASLNLQREQAEFCDCVLRMQHNPDQLYPAHRCVLAASSPVWASLLSSAGALVELKASCLTDIVLVHVVDYIYTGALPIDPDQQEWSALLAAAFYLQMDGLLEALQTKVKSADNTRISSARCDHQSCTPDNRTEANVEDMCQQLSSTCSVKSPERENLHSDDVGVCGGFERRSCCENADLSLSGCGEVHSKTHRNIIQSISTTPAWHRTSEEDNEVWEDQINSTDSWQMSRDKLPQKSANGGSLLGKGEGETSDDDRNLPQGAGETRDPWIIRSKDLKGTTQDKDHQRGQHQLSTPQPGDNCSSLFDTRSSSTISHQCSGAVPVIRYSSTASVNLAALSSLPHPVTRPTVGCSKALPSGSRDNDQSADGMRDGRSNHLKAENRVVSKQDEQCCDAEALTQTVQEDAHYNLNRQDYSFCNKDDDRYWDRLVVTNGHANHCDSFQDDSQHFRTDSVAPNKDKYKQLQCTSCHVLTATTLENPSGPSPDAQSAVQSPLQESATGRFSHYEKFGPEREMIERLSDSHRSPAESNAQDRQYHRFGDWNEYAELYSAKKSFLDTVCVHLADTDIDATADADTVRESREHGNISEHSPTCATSADRKSDVDSVSVAHSYHGHIHYHCLSPDGSHFHPRHSYQHTKPWSQSGDEQKSGLIPCQTPSPPRQPLASAEQVVLLDISTKTPELLVSCRSDKTGPWLAFAQTDTSRKGQENTAGQGAEGQNTTAGSWNSENPPPALTICSSPGVPDYVKASSASTLSVRVPSAVPVSVPTNVSEQLSTPLHHPFQCSMCERSFSQRGSLNRHVRSHLGIRPFPCPRCPMTFSRQYRVTEHMRVHQRFVPERNFPKPSAPPI